jgi:DNA-binding response OmpR family regulator
MKILVCEDDRMMSTAISYKLKKDGYEVDIALDGKASLDYINQNSYDLILTDLLMPYINGMEIINHIRAVQKKDTPIIVLSSMSVEDTILEAFRLGVNDYITKPFSPPELSIRINRILKK